MSKWSKAGFRGQYILVLLKSIFTLGPVWAFTRLQVFLQSKLGILERRTPMQSWCELSLASVLRAGLPVQPEEYFRWRQTHAPRSFLDDLAPSGTNSFVGEESIHAADLVLRGEFPFFGYTQVLGFPPAWQRSPESGLLASSGHWSRLKEFESGDVKQTWEASRFGWVYLLGRAYFRSRNEKYAEAFWLLFESWLEQNPPQTGIHWKCGQEASFRTMALCFGYSLFSGSPSTTAKRVTLFVAAISAHAKRINAHVAYAASQKNNHGISEGVGLWTIGLLFPELNGAERWRLLGKKILEREVRRQVYSDGSYVQHSTNYHRVLLHDLAWAIRLGECNNDRLSDDLYAAFRRSIHFLHMLTDPESGWAPNCGANDGACVLPLSDCKYPDMRPVLQCCHYIVEHQRLYPAGSWDEEMVWLNGTAALSARRLPVGTWSGDLNADVGGYYTIRSGESWLILKGARYKDRPSHADQLHVDLWWRGENVLCDPGSFSYNAQPPFEHAFASTRYHNTVTVDGVDQMTRLSRFLWANWANANVRRFEMTSTAQSILEGEHDGYARYGVLHSRSVSQVCADTWMIVDDLTGRGEHDLRLHWLMPDVPYHLIAPANASLEFLAGIVHIVLASSAQGRFDCARAGHEAGGNGHPVQDLARGWTSRNYGRKEPARSLVMESHAALPVRFLTVITLGSVGEIAIDDALTSVFLNSRRVEISAIGQSPVFSSRSYLPPEARIS